MTSVKGAGAEIMDPNLSPEDNRIERVKMALKASETPKIGQDSKSSAVNITQMSSVHPGSIVDDTNDQDNEEKIEELSAEIDKTISDLDVKLDQVLEKHEQDFLKAYRFQMLKVQEELAELRNRANEKELQ